MRHYSAVRQKAMGERLGRQHASWSLQLSRTPSFARHFRRRIGGAPQIIEVATHTRFARGARYIRVEADGPTAVMLTFGNAWRAAAGKPQMNRNGAAVLAEFGTQRALDFYQMAAPRGPRLYKESGTDLFPTGKLRGRA